MRRRRHSRVARLVTRRASLAVTARELPVLPSGWAKLDRGLCVERDLAALAVRGIMSVLQLVTVEVGLVQEVRAALLAMQVTHGAKGLGLGCKECGQD